MTRYIISSNWASHLTWILALLSSEECFATILTSGYQKKMADNDFPSWDKHDKERESIFQRCIENSLSFMWAAISSEIRKSEWSQKYLSEGKRARCSVRCAAQFGLITYLGVWRGQTICVTQIWGKNAPTARRRHKSVFKKKYHQLPSRQKGAQRCPATQKKLPQQNRLSLKKTMVWC